jgi:hypothetical protein
MATSQKQQDRKRNTILAALYLLTRTKRENLDPFITCVWTDGDTSEPLADDQIFKLIEEVNSVKKPFSL